MSELDYTLIPNIDDLLDDIKPDSITSRTFYKDDDIRAIIFGFDSGQELSEHSSPRTVILQIIKGEGKITIGEDTHQAKAGTWIHIAPNLQHSVHAESVLVMILLMLESKSTR